MKTLYQRLKPEIKVKLKQNLQKYKHGSQCIVT